MNVQITSLRSIFPPFQGVRRPRTQSASTDLFVITKNPTSQDRMKDPRPTSSERERKENEQPATFLPEGSKSDFQLTQQESSSLENLLQWQASSSKCVIVL